MAEATPQTPMTADDAIKAGAWLLGLVASAEHDQDADGGLSYGQDALDGLFGISHDGLHWLSHVLAVATWQLGSSIAISHREPLPTPEVVIGLQRIIEHVGSVHVVG